MTLALAKLKVINFLLKILKKITLKLLYYRAKYSAGEEIQQVAKEQKFGYSGIKNRIKHIMLHDEEIMDKRWAECVKCEHLTTKEKLGKEYSSCNECGCFMKVGDNYVKIRVGTVACPVGKWGKEFDFAKGSPTNGVKPIAQ